VFGTFRGIKREGEGKKIKEKEDYKNGGRNLVGG